MKKYEHAFGKNDIRGIYGEDITEELYFNVGLSFVKWLEQKSSKSPSDMWITVTRDARLHSPSLAKALEAGLKSSGVHVIDLGLAPTPIGYYSEVVGVPENITDGNSIIAAMIITASHNPSEYNGLKMTFAHQTLNESQIREVRDITFANWVSAPNEFAPEVINYNIIPDYQNDMLARFAGIGKGIKVVVDSANATGGVVAPKLYKDLGCEVVELFSQPDGNFPNHHPNPSDEKTLDAIKKAVVDNGADIGIAFDGDSDRIGVIDNNGNSMTGDKLLLIYALDLIDSCKSEGKELPSVVSEVKCSQVLYDTINSTGANAIMCKTGHGYIKDMMKQSGAILAGEMSGHTFFKDRYYGFDDAVYAGCRIIEIIAKNRKKNPEFKIQDMLKPFEAVYSSHEVRFPCPNDKKKAALENFKSAVDSNRDLFGAEIKDIVTIDGMRIIFDGGFALIRQSNTEPVFTLRFEAKNKEQCEQFKSAMISELEKCIR